MSDTPHERPANTPRTDNALFDDEDAVPARFARQLERELNAAKAENTAMKKLILQIYYDTETYADGAPDATLHDKLCNEISSKLEPFVTPVTQTTNTTHTLL